VSKLNYKINLRTEIQNIVPILGKVTFILPYRGKKATIRKYCLPSNNLNLRHCYRVNIEDDVHGDFEFYRIFSMLDYFLFFDAHDFGSSAGLGGVVDELSA